MRDGWSLTLTALPVQQHFGDTDRVLPLPLYEA